MRLSNAKVLLSNSAWFAPRSTKYPCLMYAKILAMLLSCPCELLLQFGLKPASSISSFTLGRVKASAHQKRRREQPRAWNMRSPKTHLQLVISAPYPLPSRPLAPMRSPLDSTTASGP